jgi:hypothetical protein
MISDRGILSVPAGRSADIKKEEMKKYGINMKLNMRSKDE